MNQKNDLIIKNTITGEIIMKPIPRDNEIFFEGGAMITETNLKGIITYANRKFINLTGYDKKEIIGSPHSINRHPDMPKGAFRNLWKTIYEGNIWKGFVKNLAKDGSFYWVEVYITPKYNNEKEIIGFIAARKKAAKSEIEEAKKLYQEFNGDSHIDNKIFSSNYHEYLEKVQG